MGFLKKSFTPSLGTLKEGFENGVAKKKQRAFDAELAAEPGVITQGDLQRNQGLGNNITAAQRAVSGDLNGGIGNRLIYRGTVDPGANAALAAAIVRQNREQNLYNKDLQANNAQLQVDAAGNKKKGSIIGAIAQGAASIFSSDETIKKEVRDITHFTHTALGSLTPYEFEYAKDVGMPGKMIGIMAQDLENSEAGKTLVMEHEGNKAIDIPRAVSFILAALADLNKRLEKAGV